MTTVKQIGIRLVEEDVALLEALAHETGHVSLSDTVRYVMRQYAKEKGITAKEKPPKRSTKPKS